MRTSVLVAAGTAALAAFSLCFASFLVADQVKYMDAAGNIKFVNRPSEVPKQYILQVFTATPTPYYDKRALAEMRRKKQQAEMDARRVEMQRQRDVRRQQEQLLREQMREDRKMKTEDDASRLRTGR
jgi:hypothetical protein